MKKTYVLLLVMVLSLMTAGFSYAYWTDTLTVSGTAETGNIDVKWAPGTEYEWDDVHGVAYGNTFVRDDKTLCVEVNNMYPGSYYEGYALYFNEGSIPAKLNFVSITLNQPAVVWDSNVTDKVLIGIGSAGSPDDGWIPSDHQFWHSLTEIINNGWTLDIHQMNLDLASGNFDRSLVFGDPIEYHRLNVAVDVSHLLEAGMNIDNISFEITLDFVQDTD